MFIGDFASAPITMDEFAEVATVGEDATRLAVVGVGGLAMFMLLDVLSARGLLLLGDVYGVGQRRPGDWGDKGGLLLGEPGEPRFVGEPGDPGESDVPNNEDKDELHPVLMLILMDDLFPGISRGGVSPSSC